MNMEEYIVIYDGRYIWRPGKWDQKILAKYPGYVYYDKNNTNIIVTNIKELFK